MIPQPPVPSRRWRAEAEAVAAEHDPPDPWVLRFIGALDEIDRLRELANWLHIELVTASAVDLPTLAVLLRGFQITKLSPNEFGAVGWRELDEATRERWINFAGYVADGVRRLQHESRIHAHSKG